MRKEDLFRAVGYVKDELIAEAEPVRRPAVWSRVIPIAAAALLAAGGALYAATSGVFNMKSEEIVYAGPEEEAMPETAEETVSDIMSGASYDGTSGSAVTAVSTEAAMMEMAAVPEEEIEIPEESVYMEEAAEEAAEEECANGLSDTMFMTGLTMAADDEETPVNDTICFSDRAANYDSSAETLIELLKAGVSVDAGALSIPEFVNSLEYQVPDGSSLYAEMTEPDADGNRMLLILVHALRNENVSLSLISENTGNTVRIAGDPEFSVIDGEMPVLSGEILAAGETRAMILEVSGPGEGLMLEMDTDGSPAAVTVNAAGGTCSEAMKIAVSAVETARLMKEGTGSAELAGSVLDRLSGLSENRSTEILKTLIGFLCGK